MKTSVLLAASVKIGAIIGGATEKDSDLIYDFGKNLGLAFQIQDDLLDIYGDAKVFGKIPGGDIIANKKTFLLVKALEIASRDQLKQLQELFSGAEPDSNVKVKRLLKFIISSTLRLLQTNWLMIILTLPLLFWRKLELTKREKKS